MTPDARLLPVHRLSRQQHVALVLLLVGFGLALHGEYLFARGPLVDEEFYESGFAALSESGSAYTAEGFMYPPTFAAAGLWLQERFRVLPVRHTVRWLNFSSLLFILWFTVLYYLDARAESPARHYADRASDAAPPKRRGRFLRRLWLPAFAFVLMASPGVNLGLIVGNISFLIGPLILFGFGWSHRRPIVAGLVLGLTLLIKPLIAGSLPLLLLSTGPGGEKAHRLLGTICHRRWLTAAVAGTSSLGVLWFFREHLGSMLATEMTSMAQNRSMSFYRIARLLGAGEQRLLLFSIITVLLCVFLWNKLNSPRRLLAASLLAIPMTTLAVWSHTLVLFFPVAALALGTMVRRRYGLFDKHREQDRQVASSEFKRGLPVDPHQRLEVVLVAGAVTVLYFVHSGGFPEQPVWVQIALILPAILSPPFLFFYWLHEETRAGTEDFSSPT